MMNTTYDMLERYLEQQASIYSALMNKDVEKNVKDIAVLTDNEAKLAEECNDAHEHGNIPLSVHDHPSAEDDTKIHDTQ